MFGLELGGWVDDGETLREKWQPGMGVRRVNYCIGEDDLFRRMQLVVGLEDDEENWIPLLAHGAAGGSCRGWKLQPDDYIRMV